MIEKSLRRYAKYQPLDLLGTKQIQAELLMISGDAHDFRGNVGVDECLLCGRERTNLIHDGINQYVPVTRESD